MHEMHRLAADVHGSCQPRGELRGFLQCCCLVGLVAALDCSHGRMQVAANGQAARPDTFYMS